MILCRFVRQSLFMLCLSMIAAAVLVQPGTTAEYEPHVGQDGKDVVWVPTCQELVDKMLAMAKATPEDYVIDLGSGDGRTVITAAKRGIRALGIEYNPDMVALSKRNAAKEGVADKAQFIQADLFESDFSQATVITMFLLPTINLKLRPRLLDFKPGTRIVSNSFTMDDWNADETATVNNQADCGNYNTAYLWIVPAKVEGTWKLPQGELMFKQTFQMISGTLQSGATVARVNGKLIGDQINFSIGNANYTGRVSGTSMQGTYTSGGTTAPWSATQVRKVFRVPSEKEKELARAGSFIWRPTF
jgi:precorrin-6B methylase 2